jgi:hypothetical protein
VSSEFTGLVGEGNFGAEHGTDELTGPLEERGFGAEDGRGVTYERDGEPSGVCR